MHRQHAGDLSARTGQNAARWPACEQHIPAEGRRWVVVVNEGVLSSVGDRTRIEWWLRHSDRPGMIARTVVLIHSLPGRLLYFACADQEEADFVRDHMVEHGCHPTAVKVRRIGHTITCAGCLERRPFWAGRRCKPCFESWLNRPTGGTP